ERIGGIVVTVRQIARQRDALLIERIAELQRQVFAQSEAQPGAEAQRLGAVRDEIVGELFAIKNIEAAGNAIVQQIGVDERQRAAAGVLAILHRRLGEQAAAEEVTLGNADFAQRTVRGRITTRYREVAGRFLLELNDEHHAIARGTPSGRDLHGRGG